MASLGDFGKLAGGIGSAVAGIGGLFGGKKKEEAVLPKVGFVNLPGLSISGSTFVRTPAGRDLTRRLNEIGDFTRGLRGGLLDVRSNLSRLRGEVRPGFGRLSQIVRERGGQAVGNLRSQLARRGLLGSSFAEDAISRTKAEFAQAEAQVTVQEIAASLGIEQLDVETANALLQQSQQEANVVTAEIQRQLQEFAISTQFLASVAPVVKNIAAHKFLEQQAFADIGFGGPGFFGNESSGGGFNISDFLRRDQQVGAR